MKKTSGMTRMAIAAALLSAFTARAELRAAWEFNESDTVCTSVSATAITKTTATLSALLGTACTSARLHVGESDGGDGAWDQTYDFGAAIPGLLSTNLTGLTSGTLYYYRFVVTTAEGDTATETSHFNTFSHLPTDIPDLQLWLRSDAGIHTDAAGTIPAAHGDTISHWQDHSGNNRHATRSDSNNITYERDSLNGMPVIRTRDTSGSGYLNIASYTPAATDDLTVFLISRADTQTLDSSTRHTLITSGTPNVGGGAFGISVSSPSSGGAANLGFFGRGWVTTPHNNTYTSAGQTPNFSDGQGHLLTLTLSGAATNGPGLFTGWYDGTLTATHSGSTNNPDCGPVQIGGASAGADRRYAGSFGDILIYNRVLTDDERNHIGHYLQEKFGIPGAYRNPAAAHVKQHHPTAVTTNTATLTAQLLGGDLPATVTLYWGPADGHTNPQAWAHTVTFPDAIHDSLLTANLTGLTPGATYHFRFCGHNHQGPVWATPATFTTWRELPSDIPGLQLWLKADESVHTDAAGTIPAAHGDNIHLWQDHSGRNRHATRASTLDNNVTYERDSLNGMPIIRTKDVNTSGYLKVDGYTPAATDDLTVFLISRADAQTLDGSTRHTLITSGTPDAGAGNFGISVSSPSSGGAGNLGFFGRGWVASPFNNTYTSADQTPNFSDGQGHLLTLQLTGASTGGNGLFTGWYDGTFTTNHPGATSNPNRDVIRIGGSSVGSDRRYAGSFGDILIYNRALNDDERNRVGWHLQTKYGLTGAYRNPYTAKLANTAVTALTTTTATLATDVADGDLPATVTLYWGETDGGTDVSAWAGTQQGDTVSAHGAASASITGLTPGTIYHARFSADNPQGRAWSDTTLTFTTHGPPIITTGLPTATGLTTAILQGTLIATSGAPSQVTAYWGTTDGADTPAAWQHTTPPIPSGTGPVAIPLTGLTPNTTYHYRLHASNSHGGRWAPTSQRFTTPYIPDIKTDGLVLWLRADLGITHTGGLAEQWRDQATAIGGPNDATTTGAARPAYITDAINGRAALRFDGTHILTIPDNDALDLGTGAGKGWTILTVYQRDSRNNGRQIFFTKGTENTIVTDWRIYIDANQLLSWVTGSNADPGAAFSIKEPTTGTPHILAATLTQTGNISGTKTLYVNGIPNDSPGYATKASANDSPVIIGGYAQPNEGGFIGLIAEILVFNHTLADDHLNNVGHYLQEKYGIPGLFERRMPRGTLMILK